MGCVGGSEGMPPGNFEVLHALECVLGAPEALFHACTQYISISSFRLKSTMYGALGMNHISATGVLLMHARYTAI